MARSLALSLLALPVVFAAQVPTFVPPSETPFTNSPNEGGPPGSPLTPSPIVPGLQFDRFVQIWLENTDFTTAMNTPAFQEMAAQGITLSGFYALTHPSEPNYMAFAGGDFWGSSDDNLYNIPANISTIVDLLEAKNISWASYQESMNKAGDEDFTEDLPNYVQPGTGTYTYYWRKHNHVIIYDSVASVPARRQLIRTFNDFNMDLNNSALPQWMVITPNIVNDAHDTDIDFAGAWLRYWLFPLLNNSNFNTERTLISVTFDENESSGDNNQIFTVLLGGAIPAAKRNTTDPTYYTHYSSLSTVEVNWGLGCLGRHDTDPVMANVFQITAEAAGYKGNNALTGSSKIPLTNISGTIPGPLNPNFYVPFPAPDTSRPCPGGGQHFIAQGVDMSITAASLPAPVNLTALNQMVPASGPRIAATSAADSGSPTPTSPSSDNGGTTKTPVTSGAATVMANMVLSLFVAGVATYFAL